MRQLLTTAFLFFAAMAVAQPESTPVKAGRTPEGIIYFLPKTELKFHLLIEKTTYRPGIFAKYAERYLQLSEIEQAEEETYRLIDCVVEQTAVRDTSKCFAVRFKGGKCETAEVHVSEDGILQAINAEPLKAPRYVPFTPSAKRSQPQSRRYLSAEILAAGSTAKVAELTASQLVDLQLHRRQLITGEADDMPKDARQLQLMLDEIDRQADAMEALFRGTLTRDTIAHVITVCPEQEVSKDVLFRLSRHIGLVDKDDLSGVPYYMTIEDLHHTTPDIFEKPLDKKNRGIYANVPGRIRVSLHRNDEQLCSFEFLAPQFGFLELRGADLFKRFRTHLQMNPLTGAIESLHADPKKP